MRFPRWMSLRSWVGSAALVVAALLAVCTARVLLANCHTVIAQQIYRSAQPDPNDLAHYIRRNGVRSIINLRGSNPTAPWYQAERALALDRGVSFYDAPIDSATPPRGEELQHLVEVLVHCPKPVLIHCRSGIDRTSMASALAILLLSDDSSPAEALRQFSWHYGYLPWTKHAKAMEAPLYAYEAWLAGQGLKHRADRFQHWLLSTP